MDKIALATDSNSGLTSKEAKILGVGLLPMPFFLNGELEYEGDTCTKEEFYVRLRTGAEVATSQPFPDALMRLWSELLQHAETVVYIPMSSGLSGSCQTAKALAAADFPGRVFVVDNRRVSLSQRQSVLDALALVRLGFNAPAICRILEREALNAAIYVAVDTLKYLKKGGRVTPAAAAVATVLNLKPVLQIQGDKLDAYKKVRGMEQARQVLLEAARHELATRFAGVQHTVHVAWSGAPELGKSWQKYAAEALGRRDVTLCALPLSIACHTGEGALGIAVMKTL